MKLWPSGGLWRHPDFIKLWSAETVSQFGTQFTLLALPLVAIDNVFASSQFARIAVAPGPRLGSDHRPIVADLALQPGADE